MKARIRCIALFSEALKPYAVITATVRKIVYVYLDYEERTSLWSLWREHGVVAPYTGFTPELFPSIVRGHAIDPESGEIFEGSFTTRGGNWLSAEGLWVRSDAATSAIDSLNRYRREKSCAADRVAAPDWRCLTAVRALAVAHGLPDPGRNSDPPCSGHAPARA
jgi:hypothetical protein